MGIRSRGSSRFIDLVADASIEFVLLRRRMSGHCTVLSLIGFTHFVVSRLLGLVLNMVHARWLARLVVHSPNGFRAAIISHAMRGAGGIKFRAA